MKRMTIDELTGLLAKGVQRIDFQNAVFEKNDRFYAESVRSEIKELRKVLDTLECIVNGEY